MLLKLAYFPDNNNHVLQNKLKCSERKKMHQITIRTKQINIYSNVSSILKCLPENSILISFLKLIVEVANLTSRGNHKELEPLRNNIV